MTEIRELALSAIALDRGTQLREGELRQDAITEYAEAMRRGDDFPPVVVFGDDYILADGFYRHAAATMAGFHTIPAEIREGGQREALRYAITANANHGIRRTNKDKRNQVRAALLDDKWRQWPNTDLAKLCHVSVEFVRKLRNAMVKTGEIDDEEVMTVKQGDKEVTRPRSNRCNPKSQDDVDFSDARKALESIATFAYDGTEFAKRHGDALKDEAQFAVMYLTEYLEAL